MQWALDALDGYARNCKCEGGGGTTDAAEALRARLEKWTAKDMAYRPGGLSQSEQEPVVKWDASAPLVVHPHPAFQATQPQPDLAKVGEVGVWGKQDKENNDDKS